MRLAAVFTQEHYLLEDNSNLNFGGQYIYYLTQTGNFEFIISREINNDFIPNFFGAKFSLVSSIVGSNGSGKTSLLNSLLLNINNNSIGIVDCKLMVMIFEFDNNVHIVYNSSRNDHYLFSGEGFAISSQETKLDDASIIFYTPILDIRDMNINFTNSHFIDLSKYKFFQNDTEDESGTFSELSELHQSENLKRWITLIQYLGNDISEEFNYFPNFNNITITANRVYTLLNNFDDVSYGFRDYAKYFYKKWQNEYHSEVKVGNKRKLQLNLILSVIEKTFKILERTGNKYLSEGKVNLQISQLDDYSLEDSFYLFLDYHYFERYEDVFLPKEEIKDLIEILINNLPEEKDIMYNNWDKFNVGFDVAYQIIEVYRKFINSFTNNFTLDPTILLAFKPSADLSSGEKGLLDLFSSFYTINKIQLEDNLIIFIDEGETSFHPQWKKKFVNSLVSYLPVIFGDRNIQVIFSTHDALTLSDIPSNNIIYLQKENGKTKVLRGDQRPSKSFGANITDLLADSFFIKDGLMGYFAKNKIQLIIDWLNNPQRDIAKKQEYKNVICLIDEPLIRTKLMQNYYNHFPEDFDKSQAVDALNAEAIRLGYELKKI